MAKFRYISTELLPLICVKIGFHALSKPFLVGFLQTLYTYKLIFGRSGLRLLMGIFHQISTELLPLIYVGSKDAKIRNRYNQVPHLTQIPMGK